MSITVTKPYIPDRARLNSYLARAIDSRQLTNDGPLVKELTIRLEEYLGVENLILVANGTMALQLSIKAIGKVGPVITTPFSFPATTSALLWSGCTPEFHDIDPDTFNIIVEPEKMISEHGITAILATHVFGNPCDIEKLSAIATNHDVPLIFDAAGAFSVKYRNESVLNFGDMSVLSFHATKMFHCVEGGALVVSSDEQYEKVKKMINFGYDAAGEISEIGINAKMNELEAAMGLAVLDEIEIILAKYRERSLLYDEILTDKLIRQEIERAAEHNHSYFPICFPDTSAMVKTLNCLSEKDVFPRRYFHPSLDTLPAYGGESNCAISADIASRIICLPLYADLKIETVKDICSTINACVD
jgi:dTDP-4-amino-4,6-dideoxygalactose transaminase